MTEQATICQCYKYKSIMTYLSIMNECWRLVRHFVSCLPSSIDLVYSGIDGMELIPEQRHHTLSNEAMNGYGIKNIIVLRKRIFGAHIYVAILDY